MVTSCYQEGPHQHKHAFNKAMRGFPSRPQATGGGQQRGDRNAMGYWVGGLHDTPTAIQNTKASDFIQLNSSEKVLGHPECGVSHRRDVQGRVDQGHPIIPVRVGGLDGGTTSGGNFKSLGGSEPHLIHAADGDRGNRLAAC